MRRFSLNLRGLLGCSHRPGRPCIDPDTGEEYQPCTECGKRLRLAVSFRRTLALPKKANPTGIEKVHGR